MSDDPFNDTDRLSGPIDAQFEPAPAVPETAARRGPGWMALGAASVLSAALGAAAGIAGTNLLPVGRTSELAEAQARLDARLTQVVALQAAIDQKLSEPAAASAELAGLLRELDTVSQRLDQAIAATGDPAGLAARVDALEGRAPRAAGDPQVALLTERLRTLEAERVAAAAQSEAAAASGNRAEAALALSAIEAATRRGAGFEADYRALRKALPQNDAIKRIAPYLSGVTSLASLQAEFPALRASVLAAASPETASPRLSWVDKMFGDAVSVRPANGKHSATTKALDQAAAALAAGDLATSVRALGVLDAGAAAAAEDWTRRANRRITLEEALEAVRLSLVDGED